MKFREHFGFSFYDLSTLIEIEMKERTRQHEGGHRWLGTKKGAKYVSSTFDHRGVSQESLRGLKSLEDLYDVGVAGLLAEALAIKKKSNGDCEIAVDRLSPLAKRIYDEFRDEEPDPDSDVAIEPGVPMNCGFPSTIKSQISVSDMVKPIKRGLREKKILEALTRVANVFNDPDNWREFQQFVNENYPSAD